MNKAGDEREGSRELPGEQALPCIENSPARTLRSAHPPLHEAWGHTLAGGISPVLAGGCEGPTSLYSASVFETSKDRHSPVSQV